MPQARDDAASGALPRREEFGFGRPFESVPEAMALLDEQGRILLWNPSAASLFGHAAEEVVGQDAATVISPDVHPRHVAAEAAEPFEVRATRRDGAPLILDTTLTSYPYEGRLLALAIMRDVTRRVQERAAREARLKELTDAVESLEAFAHVIAHDLKEPVRGMAAYLEELEAGAESPAQKETARRALEANRNLKHLLDGLLEWSRTTMTPLEPRPLRLREVLTDPGCTAQWDSLARERRARIDIAHDIPPVLATEALVCRVFGNLITNAIRHNPRDEPSVRIRLGAARRGVVEVLVEDDGPGFPAALARPMRAGGRKPRTIKGGFGLSITQRAVERLGGSMTILNSSDGGGIVRVALPAVDAARSTIEQRVRELV